MNRIDISMDLETLGTNNTPVITQIAAVAFNIETGKIFRKFSLTIDIQSCLRAGLKVDALTIKWWMQQDKEVIKEVMNGETTLSSALKQFTEWIYVVSGNKIGAVYLWGNGILADNAWLKGAYESLGIPYPIHYKNDRDVRTLLELGANTLGVPQSNITKMIPNEGKKHNALNDAIWASKLISNCWNIIVR